MSQYSIESSSELMQNYLNADILDPQKKFQALQAKDGTALLFSISTDQALYVTKEQSGVKGGWTRWNLSQSQIAHDFKGATKVGCSDFAAQQSTVSEEMSIDLAMVVNDGTNDHLYLSLHNSSVNTTWTENLKWVAYPFDDPNHTLSSVNIVGVQISQANDGEYIVVDVLRDPASSERLIFRYYIDTSRSGGYAWHPHDVSIDLEAGHYMSCLGRKQGGVVDGLYTSGTVTGVSQFQYQPLYNAFNPNVPASPDILHLPGGLIPDAIAACRNADNTTDLYATASNALFSFASSNQGNGATAVQLVQHPLFMGVRSLFASADGEQVMVWGLNDSNQIFYTTCLKTRLTDASAWSTPVPILSGVEQVSPFVNRAYSANTFFAHTGQNQLTKAVKSPSTTLWTFRPITLPPLAPNVASTQRFHAYTTRVQVLGPNGQPAGGETVTIQAKSLVSVYINNLYYVIGNDPIEVETDALGTVTLVEAVETMAGTRLTVTVGDAQQDINPMEKAFQKATSLTSREALSQATITYPDGHQKKLLPSGVKDDELDVVATGNQKLATAYASVSNPSVRALTAGVSAAQYSVADLNALWVDAGDLFAWLSQGADYLVRLVKDAATDVWHFVVTLAGETYACALDAVEKVVAAAQWLYVAIKTAVKDLLQYLAFLFEWADITRTKEVLVNLIKVYLQQQVDEIEVIKQKFDEQITGLEADLQTLLGGDAWNGLGSAGKATANQKSTPAAGQSAPGSLLSHHYTYNAQNTTVVQSAPPVPQPPGDIITVLLNAVKQEEQTVTSAVHQLTQLGSSIGNMPLEDALKALMEIVGEATLASVKTVIDAFLDVLYDVAEAGLGVLDEPIRIPLVSDILSDFGVPSFSFLDIVCWVAAVPVTIGYKAVHGTAPFPDNEETSFLIHAPDYATLLKAFSAAPVSELYEPIQVQDALATSASASHPVVDADALVGTSSLAASGPISISKELRSAVHIIGHEVAGFTTLFGAIVSGFEAAQETGENPWSIPSTVLAIVGGGAGGGASALVPYDPLKNSVVSWISKVTTGLRLIGKVSFAALNKRGVSFDTRAVGSIVDAVLVIPALPCSGWHFYELAEAPDGDARNIAIVDETSSLTGYIARASYTVAVNTEAEVKAAAVAVLAVANVLTGGLQIAEGALAQP